MPKKNKKGRRKGGAKGVKRGDKPNEKNAPAPAASPIPNTKSSSPDDESPDSFALRKVEIQHQGDGKTRPRAGDVVVVHYIGSLANGEIFDSSVAKGVYLMRLCIRSFC